MGPNGSGKSTLLKTFAGTPAAARRRGHVRPQRAGRLLRPDPRRSQSEGQRDRRGVEPRSLRRPRSRCGATSRSFSFFDDDVFKKTRELSGGEKGRLALAKIMYVGGNVMLLDEPTNHLDVYTREALEEALESFTGALIVVSHDRYFIDRVAENVIVVEDGSARGLRRQLQRTGGALQGRRGHPGEGRRSLLRSRCCPSSAARTAAAGAVRLWIATSRRSATSA